MNDKMLELYRLAHVKSTAIDPSNNMPYETTSFSAEKFSQLIVEKCMNLCSSLETCYAGETNMTPNEIAKDTAKSCAEIINEYFGVG